MGKNGTKSIFDKSETGVPMTFKGKQIKDHLEENIMYLSEDDFK